MKSVIASVLLLISSVSFASPLSDLALTAGHVAASQTGLGMGLGYVIANHKPQPGAYVSVHCKAPGYEFDTTAHDAQSKGLNCK